MAFAKRSHRFDVGKKSFNKYFIFEKYNTLLKQKTTISKDKIDILLKQIEESSIEFLDILKNIKQVLSDIKETKKLPASHIYGIAKLYEPTKTMYHCSLTLLNDARKLKSNN